MSNKGKAKGTIENLKKYALMRKGTHISGMRGKKQSKHFFDVTVGRKQTPESNKKRSETAKKSGCGKWLKGRKMSPERIKTLKDSIPRGDRCHFWKGGISPTYKIRRKENLEKNGGHHSLGEWETLKAQYNWTCNICKKIEPEIKLTRDHIIPVIKGGSNNIENIQPLCQSCNSIKNDKILD